ncbi:MAG: DUF3877 family protein [Eubacteriales bacterium]|nr:DUF3877 family protein [Eubacteriales bacterium]
MKTEALLEHICDTVKEWQLKIGYSPEHMKLYYPDTSLRLLLELGDADLDTGLREFVKAVKDRLGDVAISSDEKKERYCIDIPPEGVTYIAREVPDSEFLKEFLKVTTTPGSTMEDVGRCFEKFGAYTAENHGEDGLGQVFSFVDQTIDKYVYCVELDGFGMTYHRFDRRDYSALKEHA